MGRGSDAVAVVEAIKYEKSLVNRMCSIAFCTVLAFVALAHYGVPAPTSRLDEGAGLPELIGDSLAAGARTMV